MLEVSRPCGFMTALLVISTGACGDLSALGIIEVSGTPRLEELDLGAAPGILHRVQLRGNPALAGEDRQRLLERIDEQTETTLD